MSLFFPVSVLLLDYAEVTPFFPVVICLNVSLFSFVAIMLSLPLSLCLLLSPPLSPLVSPFVVFIFYLLSSLSFSLSLQPLAPLSPSLLVPLSS